MNNLETQSKDSVIWYVSYNPAFVNFKPWWITSFSLGLLQPDIFLLNADLNPGFCPYYPTLTKKDVNEQEGLL